MFIPKEVKFFDIFEELSSKIKEGSEAFVNLVTNFENPGAKIERIKKIEHEADNISHGAFEKLHKTFLTPIDREDIYAMISKMDNILDLIDAASQRMNLYRIDKPIDDFIELTKVLDKTVNVLHLAIYDLRHLKRDTLVKRCIEINTLENEGDHILRTSMANLFDECQDMKHLIKWKELLEIVEHAIDTCEDVANIIEGIVIKNA